MIHRLFSSVAMVPLVLSVSHTASAQVSLAERTCSFVQQSEEGFNQIGADEAARCIGEHLRKISPRTGFPFESYESFTLNVKCGNLNSQDLRAIAASFLNGRVTGKWLATRKARELYQWFRNDERKFQVLMELSESNGKPGGKHWGPMELISYTAAGSTGYVNPQCSERLDKVEAIRANTHLGLKFTAVISATPRFPEGVDDVAAGASLVGEFARDPRVRIALKIAGVLAKPVGRVLKHKLTDKPDPHKDYAFTSQLKREHAGLQIDNSDIIYKEGHGFRESYGFQPQLGAQQFEVQQFVPSRRVRYASTKRLEASTRAGERFARNAFNSPYYWP